MRVFILLQIILGSKQYGSRCLLILLLVHPYKLMIFKVSLIDASHKAARQKRKNNQHLQRMSFLARRPAC